MTRRFRRSGRRSVAWLPGLTTYDTAGNGRARTVSLTVVAAAVPATFGAAIALTTDTDLSQHGGEDAVLTRIRGRLYFSDGKNDLGAGLAASGFQMRVVVAQASSLASGATMATDHTTSFGLGDDGIMYSGDVLVSSVVTSGTGVGIDGITWEGHYLDIDVRAKRKVTSDSHIMLWFQTVVPAGGILAQFVMRGTLRLLMMRPR